MKYFNAQITRNLSSSIIECCPHRENLIFFLFNSCEVTFNYVESKWKITPDTTFKSFSVCVCKWRHLWFLFKMRIVILGNNRPKRGEKRSDTRSFLSFKSVTQADGSTWEISFGWRPSQIRTLPVTLLTDRQPWLQRQSKSAGAWEVTIYCFTELFHLKNDKTICLWPAEKFAFGSSLVPLHPQCRSWHATQVNPD